MPISSHLNGNISDFGYIKFNKQAIITEEIVELSSLHIYMWACLYPRTKSWALKLLQIRNSNWMCMFHDNSYTRNEATLTT